MLEPQAVPRSVMASVTSTGPVRCLHQLCRPPCLVTATCVDGRVPFRRAGDGVWGEHLSGHQVNGRGLSAIGRSATCLRAERQREGLFLQRPARLEEGCSVPFEPSWRGSQHLLLG